MNKEEIKILAKLLKADMVETHISWVLLTAGFAYKIKKPVKTSFLDFSTLSKRKKFCFIEIELNKILSPEVYLEVIGIKKNGNNFLFAPLNERPIEYAVKMRRLDSNKEMDVLLAKGKVGEEDIKRLARELALFHSRTKAIRKNKNFEKRKEEFNDLLLLKDKMIEIFGLDYYRQIETSVKQVNEFLERNIPLFAERIKGGFKRDCHGDLHSGNIFLYKKPVLFDRIEFSEKFRQIDVLHEIGFLCMDIEYFGKKKLSELCIESYLKFSGMDFGAKEELLFNYYKCYTANVRAKVNLLSSEDMKLKNRQKIKRYLQLMKKYSKKL